MLYLHKCIVALAFNCANVYVERVLAILECEWNICKYKNVNSYESFMTYVFEENIRMTLMINPWALFPWPSLLINVESDCWNFGIGWWLRL